MIKKARKITRRQQKKAAIEKATKNYDFLMGSCTVVRSTEASTRAAPQLACKERLSPKSKMAKNEPKTGSIEKISAVCSGVVKLWASG